MQTIQDVAKYAGVSTASVSHYLNKSAAISPKMQKKIERAIRDLGYIPNGSARQLRSQRSRAVGVILPNANDVYNNQVLQGIENYLRNNMLDANIAFSRGDPQLEVKLINSMQQKRVDGIILITCQPTNAEYFSTISTPIVLVDHDIPFKCLPYVSFDFKSIVKEICFNRVTRLNETVILAGPNGWYTEDAAVSGFVESFVEANIRLNPIQISRDATSKESAFLETLRLLRNFSPRTIISTSNVYTEGIVSALNFLGKNLTKEITIYSFEASSIIPRQISDNIVCINRPSFQIGEKAAQLLYKQLQNESPSSFIFKGSLPPANSKKEQFCFAEPFELHILMPNITIAHNIACLFPNFESQFGGKLIPHFIQLQGYLDYVERNYKSYDLFLFDRPWINQLAENGILADVTSIVRSPGFESSNYLNNCLDNMCKIKDSYYGVPYISTPQILFYRKDLFSNYTIQQEYKNKTEAELRPPESWSEYNQIAEFFRDSRLAKSFVDFGCGFVAASDDAFSSEFFPRFRSLGGKLFDQDFKVSFVTPEAKETFWLLKHSFLAAKGPCFEKTLSDELVDFLCGKTAMISTFRQPMIVTDFPERTVGAHQIGCTHLPAKSSILGGWCMGVSSKASKLQYADAFLKWSCQEDLSPYLAILTGQSVISNIYIDTGIQSIYPWFPLVKEILEYAQPLVPPSSNNGHTVPLGMINRIVYDSFCSYVSGKMQINDALLSGEKKLRSLFEQYGYPQN